jgi:hypothetical protein
MGALGGLVGGVSDADMSRFGRFRKSRPKKEKGMSDKASLEIKRRLMRDMGFDPNAKGGVGSLKMDLFRRSR